MRYSPDISHELVLQRWHNGIRLARPNERGSGNEQNSHLLGDFLNLNFNIYLLDQEGRICDSSEVHAATLGFPSVKSSIGKGVHDLTKRQLAESIQLNNISVLKSDRINILEENLVLQGSGNKLRALSIKSPLYNHDGTMIGLFGCSILLGLQDLATSFVEIVRLGLLNNKRSELIDQVVKTHHGDVHLSLRERQIFQQLASGKSARLIGEVYDLSRRTVEYYIEKKESCLQMSQSIQYTVVSASPA
jgi:DNA-binding CsgD family transcriptional regulator